MELNFVVVETGIKVLVFFQVVVSTTKKNRAREGGRE